MIYFDFQFLIYDDQIHTNLFTEIWHIKKVITQFVILPTVIGRYRSNSKFINYIIYIYYIIDPIEKWFDQINIFDLFFERFLKIYLDNSKYYDLMAFD